jgi:FkbM family methyltransferase
MNKKDIKKIIGKNNPVIFEIGCADGIDTQEFIDEFGQEIVLHCFEPDPRNASVFTSGGYRPINPNFDLPVSGGTIFFNQCAIGSMDGKMKMYQTNTIYSSSLKKPTDNLFQTWNDIKIQDEIEIDCIKLDTYSSDNDISIIDFIWADVQGAEDYLIEGGRKTLNEKTRYFYTEYAKDKNNSYYNESPDLERILSLLGENWILLQDFGTDALFKNTKHDNN